MRLSPKSIQLANKLSTVQSGGGVGSAVQPESGQRLSADGVGWPLDAHRVAANNNDGGSASRIDVERGGSGSDSKVRMAFSCLLSNYALRKYIYLNI